MAHKKNVFCHQTVRLNHTHFALLCLQNKKSITIYGYFEHFVVLVNSMSTTFIQLPKRCITFCWCVSIIFILWLWWNYSYLLYSHTHTHDKSERERLTVCIYVCTRAWQTTLMLAHRKIILCACILYGKRDKYRIINDNCF